MRLFSRRKMTTETAADGSVQVQPESPENDLAEIVINSLKSEPNRWRPSEAVVINGCHRDDGLFACQDWPEEYVRIQHKGSNCPTVRVYGKQEQRVKDALADWHNRHNQANARHMLDVLAGDSGNAS